MKTNYKKSTINLRVYASYLQFIAADGSQKARSKKHATSRRKNESYKVNPTGWKDETQTTETNQRRQVSVVHPTQALCKR